MATESFEHQVKPAHMLCLSHEAPAWTPLTTILPPLLLSWSLGSSKARVARCQDHHRTGDNGSVDPSLLQKKPVMAQLDQSTLLHNRHRLSSGQN